jgi:hypothetical protein
MNKTYWKVMLSTGLIGIAMLLYVTVFDSPAYSTIDMTGNKEEWRAALNIQVDYDNEFVATVVTEEYEPPAEVFVEIMVKGESVYEYTLEKQEDDYSDSGIYRGYFDSNEHLEKNYEDVSVLVSFNGDRITIPLTTIETLE